MKFGVVRKYYSDVALGLKYSEHYDGFPTDNVPKTRLDRAFHVEAFTFNGSPQNQLDVRVDVPVTVRLFFKGYKIVNETILQATLAGESYIEKVLASETRLRHTDIRNVIFNQMFIEPYSGTNDNSVVCRMEFSTILFKGIC